MGRQTIGIIGYGRSVYERSSSRSEFSYLWEAARNAVHCAGIAKNEIDGLAISSTTLGGDNAVTASEVFGLQLSWATISTAGGAGALITVMNAIRAVEAGRATYVICVAGAKQDSTFFQSRVRSFNRAVADYLAPHGFGGMNGLFALIQRKHMDRFGTTCEALGRIAVDQRANARANPDALLRGMMTINDYLAAPVIADPLRLYDCVMPCSGAEAIIVGPLERAAPGKRVAVLASGERHNHRPDEAVPVEGGWRGFRDALYDEAGLGPADVQMLQAYDDYPIMVAIQIEDLGFCAKGDASPFLVNNDLTAAGSFPVNTGGGQLSCGQAGGGGGLIGLTEAVRQLRGEGGARQVPGVSRGLVSGYGMVTYGHGLSASAMIVSRVAG